MIRKLWRALRAWLVYIAFWALWGLILVLWLKSRGF